jgi:hypothetical protein
MLLGGKMQQQAEGVAITEPDVRTQVALGREILGEEPPHEPREIVDAVV